MTRCVKNTSSQRRYIFLNEHALQSFLKGGRNHGLSERAGDFPEGLLKQIQRYVSGETIYVPAREEKKAWGETSGYQQYIRERNREIRQGFEQGKTIDQFMDRYALSYDSIKRIVYSRKEIAMLRYSATLSSARAYRAVGQR